jgi:MFS family permease
MGSMADRFGRKPTVMISHFLQAIAGIALAFLDNFPAVVALKFVQAVLVQGLQNPSITLSLELITTRIRAFAPVIKNCVFPASLLFMSVLWYLRGDWRTLHLACSAYSFVCIAIYWFIPESIRWLVAQGRVHDAHENYKKYARLTGLTLPDDIDERLHIAAQKFKRESTEERVKYNITDLFKTPCIRRYTIAFEIACLATSLQFYGASFYIPKLDGNLYINYAISGVMDITCSVLFFLTVQRFGRKPPMMFVYASSGLLIFISAFITLLVRVYPEVAFISFINTALILLGKSLTSTIGIGTMLTVTSLYPTNIRAIAYGVMFSVARITSMLTSNILLLGDTVWVPLPNIIFGLCGIISFIAYSFIPETADFPLVDTVDEAERIGREARQKRRSSLWTKVKEKRMSLYVVTM